MQRILPALLLTVLGSGAAQAQWVFLHTEGVPRTKDGKLDRAAKTPRTPDGKPDFSGLWWPTGDVRPCPASLGGPENCLEKGLGNVLENSSDLVLATVNMNAAVSGGLPYQPWVVDLMKQRDARAGLDDPHLRCLPSNLPRLYTLPHLTRMIQTPKILAMLNEFNASYRQVYLDGRKLPEDPNPSWTGYSVGHWENDTLVIETNGLRDDLWMDMRGNPLTSAAKLTERIRRPDYGTLEIDLTVDDSKAYTKPWSIALKMVYVVDTEMMDEVCLEGERSYEHMKDLK